MNIKQQKKTNYFTKKNKKKKEEKKFSEFRAIQWDALEHTNTFLQLNLYFLFFNFHDNCSFLLI